MLLREVGQHRGGDVSRLPQICADAGAEIVSRSRSVVAQFEGAGRPVHARVVHGSWFERCTGAQSSSVKAAAGGTDRREAAAAPAALPPSSTACCREMGGGERRAASRGMVKHARSILPHRATRDKTCGCQGITRVRAGENEIILTGRQTALATPMGTATTMHTAVGCIQLPAVLVRVDGATSFCSASCCLGNVGAQPHLAICASTGTFVALMPGEVL